MMLGMDCLTELFLREAQIPLTLIPCFELRFGVRGLSQTRLPPRGEERDGRIARAYFAGVLPLGLMLRNTSPGRSKGAPYTFLRNEPTVFFGFF